MASTDIGTPISRVLAKLQGVKRSDGGWVARCPGHGDTHQSLGVDVVDGNVMLRCHANCETEHVVSSMGLKMSDLFSADRPDRRERQERPERKERLEKGALTLAELCAHKKLPAEFVQSLGWSDVSNHYGTVVAMPYTRRDGSTHRMRYRLALSAKEGSRWSKGEELIAYEPDGGQRAQRDGYVVIVEGETDVATLLYCDVPAVGIPGAKATGTLEREHLDGLKCAFVVQETDEAGAKFVENVRERIAELGLELPLHVLKLPGNAKDPSALFQRDPEKFPELFHAAMYEASKPPPEPLDHVWKTLGEWGSLASEPPPRRWLLDRPDDETNGARQVGVLPLGKVGMLVAAGGVGKTMALLQLALSVATGRKWLDHFGIANEGPVLVALGEEDEEEIWRRVYQAARAMRLTDAQIEKAARNIVALPLAGTVVNLIKSADGETTETAMLAALRKRLEAKVGDAQPQWRLIILDPLSRFAGFDSEKDNAAATVFISMVESLLRAPGRPTVLLAHHTNKASRQEGAERGNAASARGASGLTDGVRWVAELAPNKDGTVELAMVKSNYSMKFETLTLTRDADFGGFLRVQTQAEATAIMAKVTEKAKARLQTVRDLVIRTIAQTQGLKSANKVYEVCGGRKGDVVKAVTELRTEGFIELTMDGFKLSERSGLND